MAPGELRALEGTSGNCSSFGRAATRGGDLSCSPLGIGKCEVLREILGSSASSHLLPPHPPYSGRAISAQARLEQSELVTSGVERKPGLRVVII